MVFAALLQSACGQDSKPGPEAPPAQPPLDWKSLEAGVLSRHTELTKREQFVKAGEAYFSSDARWIIFQAIPVPASGKDPDPFYSMYVAKLTRDAAGHITGLEKPIQVSAPDSANTCGWFHPTEPWHVMFGSTITRPSTNQRAGFRVGDRKYTWLFPEETQVVHGVVGPIFADYHRGEASKSTTPEPLFSRPDYDAECSWSNDGRFVLYAHVREDRKEDRADADIWVYDTKTKKQHAIVTADGYDGGPFFSPDGKRICYRSDRKLNDLLQLYVADLKFDAEGVPVGISHEYQITNNEAVNWAPYWHPSGKFLVYGTSEVSHANYEVFAIEINDDLLLGAEPASLLHRTRITQANGADVLPVFSRDGQDDDVDRAARANGRGGTEALQPALGGRVRPGCAQVRQVAAPCFRLRSGDDRTG
jgi:hypothetical protein